MAKFKKFDTFFESEEHFNDDYTNLGYKFDSNIMKNVLSPEMFANPINDTPIRQIERLIEFLVHQVKRIKLEYDFTMPKNSKNLN